MGSYIHILKLTLEEAICHIGHWEVPNSLQRSMRASLTWSRGRDLPRNLPYRHVYIYSWVRDRSSWSMVTKLLIMDFCFSMWSFRFNWDLASVWLFSPLEMTFAQDQTGGEGVQMLHESTRAFTGSRRKGVKARTRRRMRISAPN